MKSAPFTFCMRFIMLLLTPLTKKSVKEDLDQLISKLEAKNDNSGHHFEGITETELVLNQTNKTQIFKAAD